MKSFLKDLYDGDINPTEAIKPNSPEYKTVHEKIDIERAYLKQKLSPEDGTRFDEMEKLYLDAIDIDVFTGFSHGMKLGLLLALELLAEDGAS